MDLDLYIDIVFFVNFFMDLLLLILLKRILKKAASYRRLGIGAVLGGLFGCLEMFCPQIPGGFFAAFSFGFALLMILAAFGWSGWRELVKETGTLFILAIAAGGTMELILRCTRAGFYFLKVLSGEGAYVLPMLLWVFLAAGTFFLVLGIWQFGDEVRRERRNLYPLVLTDGRVRAEAVGYLDTGNCLTEPGSRQGVHIVAQQVFCLFQDSKGERAMIPYHTVGNPYGVMEGIRIERMEIMHGGGKIRIDAPWIAKAPYGLSKKGGYQVLLYGETTIREEKEGGIASGH